MKLKKEDKKEVYPNKNFSNKNKIVYLEEHCFDERKDETLPEDYHRGDITSSNRMLAYSDAVTATCATFLVIPIRNLKKLSVEQSLSDFVSATYHELIEFFLGFLIVLTVWENTNIRAIVVKRVDDFVLSLIIFELLATTILPFSLALQGHYPHEKVTVFTTCIILGTLQIIDIGIVLYATHSPNLLNTALKNWKKTDLKELLLVMVIRPLISLLLLAIAGAFCLVHYGLSWAFIALLIFMPTIRKLYWFICRRIKKFNKTEKDIFLECYAKGNISKERVEVMSDAAIAIIACILVLDITVDDFPEPDSVIEHGLNYELKHMIPKFLAFLATFCLVSALWYINHAVLHLFKTVNSILLYFQKIFLSFSCLCPLAGNMLLRFAAKGNYDSIIAIRFAATIVFVSSLANFFIFLYGMLTGAKYFHKWASVTHYKKNKRQHLYSFTKSLNIPFWSLVCIFGSLGPSTSAPYVLCITFIAAPCSFFFSKVVLMNQVGVTASYFKKTCLRRMLFTKKKVVESTNPNKDLRRNAFSQPNRYVTEHDLSSVIENNIVCNF
nr:endosomal/lysosomal potassium channel TMEM175-like [Hydra vulgaris]